MSGSFSRKPKLDDVVFNYFSCPKAITSGPTKGSVNTSISPSPIIIGVILRSTSSNFKGISVTPVPEATLIIPQKVIIKKQK